MAAKAAYAQVAIFLLHQAWKIRLTPSLSTTGKDRSFSTLKVWKACVEEVIKLAPNSSNENAPKVSTSRSIHKRGGTKPGELVDGPESCYTTDKPIERANKASYRS